MDAGDALVFVDALCHGAAARETEGQRRILVYRYGPYWGQTRFGYRPSEALLARLTPARRKIIQPIAPRVPPGAR
jgi:ectoine hydroxylase-related dioxygenase (phytanoyl-CoA dioxygenase family)